MADNNELPLDPLDGDGSGSAPPPPPAEPAPTLAHAPEIAQALALKEDLVRKLEARISELEREISEARAAIASQSRRHDIDLALMVAGAIDIETVRLLIEAALEQPGTPGAPPSPDTRAIVADLKAKKPFLFHQPRPRGANRAHPGPMTAALAPPITDHLADSASRAARSGDRRSLLSYLRARRGE